MKTKREKELEAEIKKRERLNRADFVITIYRAEINGIKKERERIKQNLRDPGKCPLCGRKLDNMLNIIKLCELCIKRQ